MLLRIAPSPALALQVTSALVSTLVMAVLGLLCRIPVQDRAPVLQELLPVVSCGTHSTMPLLVAPVLPAPPVLVSIAVRTALGKQFPAPALVRVLKALTPVVR